MALNARVDVTRLDDHPRKFDLEADAGERQALAASLGLVSLDRLSANIEARRLGGGLVRLEGRLVADLVQSCVVSLAPVPQAIDAHFRYDFAPPQSLRDQEAGEVVLDLDSDIEPLPGEALDLAAIVGEQLAINLDPYPRAEGASLSGLPTGAGPDGEKPEKTGKNNPFAALARLKPKG
jgi:uncharacterized metal-binding protein YceD (DUF177 family)